MSEQYPPAGRLRRGRGGGGGGGGNLPSDEPPAWVLSLLQARQAHESIVNTDIRWDTDFPPAVHCGQALPTTAAGGPRKRGPLTLRNAACGEGAHHQRHQKREGAAASLAVILVLLSYCLEGAEVGINGRY